MSKPAPRLVLASSSRYRQALLERLGVRFEVHIPAVDEAEHVGEAADELALRLAESKARVVAKKLTGEYAVIIGADQVLSCAGTILRKPGDHSNALDQLIECQQRPVNFFTALCVLGPGGKIWKHIDRTRVEFAKRTRSQLDRYLTIEQPFDCAGGFKVEGLGIALFDNIDSNDPTALIGLPLIQLTQILIDAGLDPLAASAQ